MWGKKQGTKPQEKMESSFVLHWRKTKIQNSELKILNFTSFNTWHCIFTFFPQSLTLLQAASNLYSSAHKFSLLENFIPFLFLLFTTLSFPSLNNLFCFPFLAFNSSSFLGLGGVRRQSSGKPAAKENILVNSCQSEFER